MHDSVKAFPLRTLVVLALASAGVPALAEGPQAFVLKFNHVLGAKEPFHAGFMAWAKRVEERTHGGLKIEVFHSAQLGVEEDIIERMRQGASVGQNTDSARLGNYVPDIAVMNGPYLVENLDDVARLRRSPVVLKWLDELASKHGLRVVSFNWVQGYRHFFTNQPIRTPADLKGLRIRTAPAPIWQESIRALGASPVALPFIEMYPALRQKSIDGVELVYNNVLAGRLFEVLKYANETRHIMLINFEVVSEKYFQSLPAEYRKILVEECDRAGEEVSRQILAQELQVRKQLEAKGMVLVQPDVAAFRKAGQKAFQVLKIGDARNEVARELGKK